MLDTKRAIDKTHLNDFIWDETGGRVQSGPFTGMQLLKDEAWHDGGLGAKLLGCYELELHDDINQMIDKLMEKKNPIIANIGCAEGFYAVGFARRLPKATVYADDIDENALEIAGRAAKANHVALAGPTPMEKILESPDLVFMDCEGGEVEYLDQEKHPGLRFATIIVEMHEIPGLHANDKIHARFKDTHNIKCIFSEMLGRNPNAFKILQGLHSHDKWLAVSEGRPAMMNYLVMRPK